MTQAFDFSQGVTPISGMATVYGTAPLVRTTPAVREQAVTSVAAVVQSQLTVQAQALPTIAVPVAAPAVVATASVQPMMEVTSMKMEEDAQKKMVEYSNLSHEEHMSISGSNARYMVMQKLSRKSEVSTSHFKAWLIQILKTKKQCQQSYINTICQSINQSIRVTLS
jgi:poly(U)-binding-splicing factor PUF60